MLQVDVRLAVTDSPVGDVPIKIRCKNPEHNDSSASCAVYADGIHCYGCGLHINGTKAIAWLLGNLPETLAPFTVEGRTLLLKLENIRTKRDPLLPAIADAFHSFLYSGRRSHRLSWLHNRGLNNAMIKDAKLGHDGNRFAIPIYDSNRSLVTIRYRRDDYYGLLDWKEDEIPKYASHPGRDNTMHLYPEWRLPEAERYLVICAGELDALLLWQHGIFAVTMTNGEGRLKHIPELLERYQGKIKHLYLAADQDLTGQQANIDTHHASVGMGFTATYLEWSDRYKDVTEFYQHGGKFEVSNGEDVWVNEEGVQ